MLGHLKPQHNKHVCLHTFTQTSHFYREIYLTYLRHSACLHGMHLAHGAWLNWFFLANSSAIFVSEHSPNMSFEILKYEGLHTFKSLAVLTKILWICLRKWQKFCPNIFGPPPPPKKIVQKKNNFPIFLLMQLFWRRFLNVCEWERDIVCNYSLIELLKPEVLEKSRPLSAPFLFRTSVLAVKLSRLETKLEATYILGVCKCWQKRASLGAGTRAVRRQKRRLVQAPGKIAAPFLTLAP